MSMTEIKICGLQSGEVLKSISKLQLDIDYVGFVFAESKRQVSTSFIREVAGLIPDHVRAVGVFVNPDIQELDQVMEVCPLDVIQLHGDEQADFCLNVKHRYQREVWKAWRVRQESSDFNQLPSSDYATGIDALLLDTYVKETRGGTGKPFQWEMIPLYRHWADIHGKRLLVAGGLHADNIEQLLKQYEVDGIDVSSGVETDGQKDLHKMIQVTERVRKHDLSRLSN